MPASIQASIAPDRAAIEATFRSTCAEMFGRRVPNLFRLYLNPYVAQACYCLTELVAETWPDTAKGDDYQAFLANSLEEALSGAIKLARYANNLQGRQHAGILIDPTERLKHFAATDLGDGRIDYVPALKVVADWQAALDLTRSPSPPGLIVVFHSWLQRQCGDTRLAIEQLCGVRGGPQLIVCVDRGSLSGVEPRPGPDIVVFDESFTDGLVPFGAFLARHSLWTHWTKRGMALFHSTTYQPNTISTLQMVNCLRRLRPDFIARHQRAIDRIASDAGFCRDIFSQRYNRSLAKLIKRVGWHAAELKTDGHYVEVAGRRIFDGVAGVACSIRGHNPPGYLAEIDELGDRVSCRAELAERLLELTALPHYTPAVSGASAVEHALKLGLACQHPRDHVLVMRGGFGGKTLFALTGTWKPSLRQGLDPLYPHVVYADPFAEDAAAAIEAACQRYPIGVIQFELIQGVGGVRALPAAVVRCLVLMRRKYGCLLFADEVQTGMYRTGPFIRSSELGLQPDLVTIGKGASDMMFPFAITLHSNSVEERLARRHCDLATTLRSRYDYDLGERTLLNVLRYAENENLVDTVRLRGEQFSHLLKTSLGSSQNVREVRAYGLLIGIELTGGLFPGGWLSQLRRQLMLLTMMKHRESPLLIGYCQYEPHVLKLTPPLSIAEHEVERLCQTLADVLHKTTCQIARAGLWTGPDKTRHNERRTIDESFAD